MLSALFAGVTRVKTRNGCYGWVLIWRPGLRFFFFLFRPPPPAPRGFSSQKKKNKAKKNSLQTSLPSARARIFAFVYERRTSRRERETQRFWRERIRVKMH